MSRYLSFLDHKGRITQCFLWIYVACQQGAAISPSQRDFKLTLGTKPWVDCRSNYSWVVDLNHCFHMLFMMPMKPANSSASSRAASFFSVFFLLLFSTPRLPSSISAVHARGSLGRVGGLHAPDTRGLLCTKHRGRDCSCSALLPNCTATAVGQGQAAPSEARGEATSAHQALLTSSCTVKLKGINFHSQRAPALDWPIERTADL